METINKRTVKIFLGVWVFFALLSLGAGSNPLALFRDGNAMVVTEWAAGLSGFYWVIGLLYHL